MKEKSGLTSLNSNQADKKIVSAISISLYKSPSTQSTLNIYRCHTRTRCYMEIQVCNLLPKHRMLPTTHRATWSKITPYSFSPTCKLSTSILHICLASVWHSLHPVSLGSKSHIPKPLQTVPHRQPHRLSLSNTSYIAYYHLCICLPLSP